MTLDRTFTDTYEREFPAVYRAVLLVTGDRSVAEEAAQEAFARALARWGRIGAQPWVGGWITTTALNAARRALRRRPPPPAGPDASPDETERLDVRTAVRRLPPRQQEAVVLHYLLDLPVTDTASAMGCDDGTVKTHLSRARAALERDLRTDEEPAEPRRSTDHG